VRPAALLGLLLAALAPAAAAAPSDADVAALSAALARHPDDPALVRALARARLERGEVGPAIVLLEDFGARLPAQRPAVAQLLGRALYTRGDLAAARAQLELAVGHRPSDALAHFYLGLVLLKSGETELAAHELRTARQQDPSLFRDERPREPMPWLGGHFSFMGGSGIEFDTNPTIEGEEGTTPSQGDDFRLAYQAALATQLLRSESSALSASYRFDGNAHNELEELDLMAHGFGLGGVHVFGNGAFLRLDGGAGLQRLDGDAYLDTLGVGPTLGWALGEHGVVQVRAHAERRDFADTPAEASLERDGWRYGAALSHTLPLSRWPGARLTTQLHYARTLTHGHADANGFGAAFDSNWVAADAALSVPIAFGIRMETRLLVGYERFDEDNAVQYAADLAKDPDPRRVRRRDTVIDTSVSFVRPLTSRIDFELRVRDTRHDSTTGVYDWDRQIVGTYLRLHYDR
jgi:tetratricopeptide (TPR) repeat protein